MFSDWFSQSIRRRLLDERDPSFRSSDLIRDYNHPAMPVFSRLVLLEGAVLLQRAQNLDLVAQLQVHVRNSAEAAEVFATMTRLPQLRDLGLDLGTAEPPHFEALPKSLRSLCLRSTQPDDLEAWLDPAKLHDHRRSELEHLVNLTHFRLVSYSGLSSGLFSPTWSQLTSLIVESPEISADTFHFMNTTVTRLRAFTKLTTLKCFIDYRVDPETLAATLQCLPLLEVLHLRNHYQPHSLTQLPVTGCLSPRLQELCVGNVSELHLGQLVQQCPRLLRLTVRGADLHLDYPAPQWPQRHPLQQLHLIGTGMVTEDLRPLTMLKRLHHLRVVTTHECGMHSAVLMLLTLPQLCRVDLEGLSPQVPRLLQLLHAHRGLKSALFNHHQLCCPHSRKRRRLGR